MRRWGLCVHLMREVAMPVCTWVGSTSDIAVSPWQVLVQDYDAENDLTLIAGVVSEVVSEPVAGYSIRLPAGTSQFFHRHQVLVEAFPVVEVHRLGSNRSNCCLVPHAAPPLTYPAELPAVTHLTCTALLACRNSS